MTDHLSTSQLKRFCVGALPKEELAVAAMHAEDCQSCHDQFTDQLQRQRGSEPFSFTLEPEFWFRNDHLEFEQLVELADNTWDATTRQIIGIHLKTCDACREEVESFLASRKESARQMDVSYAPTGYAVKRDNLSGFSGWRSFGFNPTYAVAALILVSLAVIIGAFVFRRGSEPLEAKKNEPAQNNALATPTPADTQASQPSPSAEPFRSPNPVPSPITSDTSSAVAVLNDGSGEVTIQKDGNVKGLDELSSISRQEIAQISLSERVERPSILKTLTGDESGLRGSSNTGQSFKLLYPMRQVILEDRPTCKWESLSGATSYKVYVLDSKGNQILNSDDLPSTETKWTATTALKRGEVYSWVVTSMVSGKEVVSPAASAPEVRFAVLSAKDAQALSQLKKSRSHLALGVFYSRVGMLAEAEREFQRLVSLNPQSQLPRKLLRSLRSLRQSK